MRMKWMRMARRDEIDEMQRFRTQIEELYTSAIYGQIDTVYKQMI